MEQCTRPIAKKLPLEARTLVRQLNRSIAISSDWRLNYLDIGANPSAEEAEEGVEDASKTVLDIAHSFRLQETSFDKKSYLTHLKSLHSIPVDSQVELY